MRLIEVMTHFACVGPLSLGHSNPMAVVARELRARGHRTTLVAFPDGAAVAARLGLAFHPVAGELYPPGWFGTYEDHVGRVRGVRGAFTVIREAADITRALCDHLPDALREIGADLVISDQVERAGGLVAYRLGLPFVSLAAALPLNTEPGLPPAFVGWSYGTTRWHRLRDTVSRKLVRQAFRPFDAVVDSFVAAWGLRHHPGDCLSPLAQISQLVPRLDLPRQGLIGCFHYCGPLRARATPRASGAPTRHVFVSLGSLQGHRARLFEDIARACLSHGLRVTIAHGGRLSPAACARLSRLAEVHDFVDQAEVIARSDLVVVHGGLNTVLDSLMAGVPLVIVPLAYEQGAIAARVERAGAGLVCRARAGRRRRLAALVGQVLREPAHAAAARRIGDEMAAAGGAGKAADIIEAVARTRRPVLSDAGLAAKAVREAREVAPPADR